MAQNSFVKESLNELLTKEMDRKAFIKHVGIAAFALTGVSAMLLALSRTKGRRIGYDIGYSASDYGNKSSLKSTVTTRKI